MVYPSNRRVVGVDDNNIGFLKPHSNSAGTDGIMLFHGVGDKVDSGEKHLTHLTEAVDCCLKARSEQNTRSLNAMISRSVMLGSAYSIGAKKMMNVLMAILMDVSMIVWVNVLVMLMMVKKMVLMILLTVVTSTSNISHNLKTMIILVVVTSTLHI
eukprot:10454060-Ditylum_brightwellii.AAC.1